MNLLRIWIQRIAWIKVNMIARFPKYDILCPVGIASAQMPVARMPGRALRGEAGEPQGQSGAVPQL